MATGRLRSTVLSAWLLGRRPVAAATAAASAALLLVSVASVTTPAQNPPNASRGVGVAAQKGQPGGAGLGRQYALVIGTDQYEAEQWKTLVNPVRDAETVAGELRASFGFETHLLKNPTRRELLDAISGLRAKTYQPNDQVLVFIAGHGYFDERAQTGALVNRDSKPRSDDPYLDSYINFSYLENFLDAIPSEHLLVILDVCYGGTFSGNIKHAGSRGGDEYADVSREKFIRRKLQYRTRQYLTSGGREYVPDGRPGRHSPFAARVIRTLRDYASSGRVLTLAGLRAAVEGLEPQPRAGSFGSDQPGSDFVFASMSGGRLTSESGGAVAPSDSRGAAAGPAPRLTWDSAVTVEMPSGPPSEQEQQEIKTDLKWLWDDHAAAGRRGPLRLADTAYVVRASPPLYRQNKSGRDCLLAAVIAARLGDTTLAVGWLKAGQAHNDAAQRRFSRHQNYAIAQLLESYGATMR